jgi:hypothetical protein
LIGERLLSKSTMTIHKPYTHATLETDLSGSSV